MITAHKQWNRTQKLELGNEFILPEINGKTITGIFQEIFPSEAEYLLKNSVGNRGTKKNSLGRLIQDMERDEYLEHIFDPIRISTKGRLLDGHHRLEAIKESGVPQILLCLYGYTMDDMVVFDQNKNRTAADNMKIQGKPYITERAAIIKWIYTMLYDADLRGSNAKGHNRAAVPGNKDAQRISDYFSDDVWQAEILWYKNNVKSNFKLQIGPIIAAKLLYDLANSEVSQDFWDGVFLGKDNTYLTKGDARNSLYTKFVNVSNLDNPSSIHKTDRYTLIKWIHYAWMKFETDQTVQRMSAPKHIYDMAWIDMCLLAKKHFVIDFGQKRRKRKVEGR